MNSGMWNIPKKTPPPYLNVFEDFHFLTIIIRMENKLNLLCVKFIEYAWKRTYYLAREGNQSTVLIRVVSIKYTHVYMMYIC